MITLTFLKVALVKAMCVAPMGIIVNDLIVLLCPNQNVINLFVIQ